MTIDDAIRFCKIESERMKNQRGSEFIQEFQLAESSKRFEQMAEWLRELKTYRIAHYKLRDMDYEYDLNSKFGKNPMYYGHRVWDLFGDIDEHQDEVMGYEEVNANDES